jgi:ABC-2 type transport system ATP-binding protein
MTSATLPSLSLAAAPPAVHLRAVDRSFRHRRGRRRVLDALDLTFDLDRVNLLFGRNGSGKSTVLRLVAGLIAPERGRVQFAPSPCGGTVAPLRLLHAGAGPGVLVGRLTIRENLAWFAAMGGYAVDAARLERLLLRLEIADRADDLVESLSRGMQQKALLVRALACRANVVLLDEPTEALDDASVDVLVDELGRTASGHAGAGAGPSTGYLVATHDARLRRVAGCRCFHAIPGGFAADTEPRHA